MNYTRVEGESHKVIRVDRLNWKPALKGDLCELRCTCCEHVLGDRPWASAWIVVEGVTFSKAGQGARLCNACATYAQEIMGLVQCPDCSGEGGHPSFGMEGWEECSACKGKKVVTKKEYDSYHERKKKL